MRSIDADALVREICRDQCERKYEDCDGMCEMVAYVEDAPTIGGWISIKDRLPDLKEDVLIVYEWTGRSGNKYREIALDSFKEMRLLGNKPLFWMPMPPEPPKEENA